MSKIMACKSVFKPTCAGWAEDGRVRCRACRAYKRAAAVRWREEHPEKYRACRAAAARRRRARNREKYRADQRRHAARYRAKQTPKAKAYRARTKVSIRAACARWTARNHARKLLTSHLSNLIARGKIIKPLVCDDCMKRKVPIVAFGLAADGDGVRLAAWCCWSCWWVRKRAAEGRG